MSQKKFKEKYNDGCVKIFKLIKLLYEDKAEYNPVMEIFAGDEPDAEKQHVTLNKFLNTLKIFGIKLQKSNKKYSTQNLPFSVNFDLEDLKAISLFAQVAKNLPEGQTKTNLENLVTFLRTRFDDNAQIAFENINSHDNRDYSFYYSSLRAQIELCESYCNSNFKIALTYFDDGCEISTFCNAQQVIYDNKKAYLRIFKIAEQEIKDVDIANILEMKYLPSPKQEKEIAKTVVFRLKGHLADAYNLHEDERVIEFAKDGSILVVNNKEPVDSLLKRLMRYDSDCVIEGPKELRNKMKLMINKTLKNYE